jgi:hypothetical protein
VGEGVDRLRLETAVIPVGAIVAALAVVNAATKNQNGPRPSGPKQPFRWAGKVWVLAIIAWIVAVEGFAVPRSSAQPLVFWLPFLLLLFPWPIARHVLIPLGLARTAYCLSVLSDMTWRLDRRGGAALAGAWALNRRKKIDAKAAEWLERRIAKCKQLGAAGVAASGLIAAARGDLDGARALLGSVDTIGVKSAPPMVRKLAAEWLAADAAARGEWAEVEERSRSLEPRTAATRFLGAVAIRLRGADDERRATNLQLWLRWLAAPERLEIWPLLRRALATPIERDADPNERRPVEVDPKSNDRMRDALGLHAALLVRPAAELRTDDLSRLSRLWDLAIGDATVRRQAAERALALGAQSGEQALAKLAFAVEDDLVAMAERARLPIGELGAGEMLERAARRLRDRLLAEIELTSEAVRARALEQRALPPIDEWREWLNLRLLCERAYQLGGLELRRLAFPKVHPDACKLAVWLWNLRSEKAIANAIFRWLLDEARAVGDQRAIELEEKNVDCDE